MIYISAQPDTPYYHWQLEVQLHNFAKFGIAFQYVILLGYQDVESAWAKKMKNKGYQIHTFKDERIERGYLPSIRPFLLTKFFVQQTINHKEIGDHLFYLDADVIFNKLPDYTKLEEGKCYVSDCGSYLGYDYLVSKGHELLYEMAEIAGISVNKILKNRNNAGGAQYIFTTKEVQTPWFWQEIEYTSNELYKCCLEYNAKQSSQKASNANTTLPASQKQNNEVQAWTADMWAVLWRMYQLSNVEVTPNLDFAWATDRVEVCTKKPILHLAGVTENLRYSHFFKGDFINQNPIELARKNPFAFDYVCGNASQKYVENIIEIANEKLA